MTVFSYISKPAQADRMSALCEKQKNAQDSIRELWEAIRPSFTSELIYVL